MKHRTQNIHGGVRLLQILALLIFSALILSCSPGEDQDGSAGTQAGDSLSRQSAPDDPPAVKTATIQEGRLRSSVFASGIIRGFEEVILRAVNPGIITEVNFELGERIRTGEVILQLDDRIADLNFRQLSREYDSALIDLESQRALYERGSISQAAYNQAQARVDGLAARREQAEDALENTRISSPIEGRVADKAEGLIPGDRISAGTRLARVVNLQRLRVELSLGQDQIFLIQEGQEARIRIPSPRGEILGEGFVQAVAAGSDPQTGSWKVIVEFDNPRPEILKAGMSAEVEIQSDLERLQPIVPAAALIREEVDSIFLLREGTAVKQQVEVLDQYGSMAAVRSAGNQIDLPGQRVLISGLGNLNDGDPVRTEDRIAQMN